MDYWYLWALFALLCVLTVFVLFQANKAAKRHNREKEQMLRELEHLKALKAEFSAFDAEKAQSTSARTLLDGVCAVIQARVERESDAELAFAALSRAQQLVYTLNCIIEDCEGEGLSPFFKNNTRPLTLLAAPALQAIGEAALAEQAQRLFEMYDAQNEAASPNTQEAAQADDLFLSVFKTEKFLEEIKRYIVQNTADFQ